MPEAVSVLAVFREPEVKREDPIVELAEERKPPERVERFVTERAPWVVRLPPNVPVDEAVIFPDTPKSFEMNV